MKPTTIILLIFILNVSGMLAQFPANVKTIECVPNQTVSDKGNLNQGVQIGDLAWAWRSSVACFPATQKTKFTGNHVLYSAVIPAHSVMQITLTPDNKNDNFSLYAYEIGTTNYTIVPELSSCVSCEADYKWDYPKAGKTQDHKRTISLNAINNPYNVVIGVVGANGLNSGSYTLEINLKK